MDECFPIPSTKSLANKVKALEKGWTKMREIFSKSELASWKKIVDVSTCSKTVPIKYPSGVKTSWPPKIRTKSKDICVGMKGLNMDVLSSIYKKWVAKAPEIYNAVAEEVSDSKEKIADGCNCKANFGVYFGAGVSAAAVAGGAISAGFIVGCDGCKFKFKPFWSWFAGVWSNVEADAGGILGYASKWDAFWGEALVNGASAGPNVVAANVGIGITLPKIKISTRSYKVEKKVCAFGECVKVSQRIGGVPNNVDFTPPKFATVDFAITAGASVLPIDVTSGFATTYEIKI